MPRVLGLFAKRNLLPRRWISDVRGPDDRELAMTKASSKGLPSVADAAPLLRIDLRRSILE